MTQTNLLHGRVRLPIQLHWRIDCCIDQRGCLDSVQKNIRLGQGVDPDMKVVPLCRAAGWVAMAAAVTLTAASASAQVAAPAAAAAPPECVIPEEYAHFELPLRRTGRRIAEGRPVKIVAVGSSSTSGAGASSPYNTYPSRLAAELVQEFVDHEFIVLNRGVGGETVKEMLARFSTGVIAEKPDLVLWQVGTNSLLRGNPIEPHRSRLHTGIERLKATGADVVLIDPQFAPAVIERPSHGLMVALLEQTARFETVNVFRRFALMRHWHAVERMPFNTFLSPDGLHMNDFSYGCIARALSRAISEAATRPVESARALARPKR
jgi:lysophospholipase L1-like esterase